MGPPHAAQRAQAQRSTGGVQSPTGPAAVLHSQTASPWYIVVAMAADTIEAARLLRSQRDDLHAAGGRRRHAPVFSGAFRQRVEPPFLRPGESRRDRQRPRARRLAHQRRARGSDLHLRAAPNRTTSRYAAPCGRGGDSPRRITSSPPTSSTPRSSKRAGISRRKGAASRTFRATKTASCGSISSKRP